MGAERPTSHELDPALLAAFGATFLHRRDCYPLQTNRGTYVRIEKPLTDETVAAHLRGYITIGAYCLDPNGWGRWLCLDADREKEWKAVQTMASGLAKSRITSYLEPSRRGGHLWFFTEELPGFQIRRFATQLLGEYAIPLARQRRPGIEIYPKQDRPEADGYGSLVRLPLGVHRITGKRYHFVDLEGNPLAPSVREQMQIFADPVRVPQTFIDEVLARAPEHSPRSPTPSFDQHKRETAGASRVSERIKASISVEEFVRQHIELDEHGKGYCPFHEDQHKSFQVNIEANYWHCYAGCGGGSIIDFAMLWRKKQGQDDSFKATISDLAKKLL